MDEKVIDALVNMTVGDLRVWLITFAVEAIIATALAFLIIHCITKRRRRKK